MSETVPKPLSPTRRLMGSRKFWVSFSAGVIAIGGQVAPFLAMLFGWDGATLAAFKSACDGISAAVGALGGILVIMIGAEDAAEKVALPPPIRGLPPLAQRGEGD